MKKNLSRWMQKLLTLALAFTFNGFLVLHAQEFVVSGTIYDANTKAPLLGATVSVKGTTNGTVTDLDGKYSLTVNTNDILVVDYLGYLREEVAVNGQTTVDINLSPDIAALDQVIVIGYGVQKKKLNTGATLNKSGEELQELNTTSAMDALKGLSPGVSITQNNGLPGAGNKVYIRGIGTLGSANPLYVVDGVAVGNIDYLNSSDIESLDILKDGASCAIYGSRGANGVVLVTTKQGKKGQAAIVDYNGYYGIQNVYKGPDLLNAKQYAEFAQLSTINAGLPEIDFASQVPDWDAIESGAWDGTNWFDEIRETNAPVQNHALNISGGSESSTYALGASYFDQQGILGKQANNDYRRINFRLNSEHTLYEKNGRKIVVGERLTYTNEHKPTIRTGNIYWSDVHSMLVASPFLPMWAPEDADPEHQAAPYHDPIRWDRQEGNPVASMVYQSKWNTNNYNTLVGNAYINIEPIRGLSIHSALGINHYNGSSRSWSPAYVLSSVSSAPYDQVSQNMYSGYTWTSTNIITYTKDFGDHNITAMVSNELIKNASSLSLKGENDSSWFADPKYAYLDNFDPLDENNASLASFGGRDDYGWGLASYLARLSYNYKETYLLTFVARADGSANLSPGHRWGDFYSASAGWVISNEDFMEPMSSWLSSAKLRASIGQNGNQSIDQFVYLSTISLEDNYYFFGTSKEAITLGSTPARVPNPEIGWETQVTSDIGLDANFLNNRLQTSLGWYRKDTKDWLIQPPSSAMDGTEPPWINGGLIKNTGVEFMASWNDNRGDFKYGVTATAAFNKNLVVEIPSADSIVHGPSNVLSQGTQEMFRAEAGYPVGYFWGYETDGLMLTDEDVANYVAPAGAENAGEPYFSGNPNQRNQNQYIGDVKFVDQNGDGVIDEEDRVMIGNPHPDVILGLQINLDYRGIYMSLTGNGMLGHQIAKNYRSVDSYRNNWTQYDYENTWSETNPSGTLPRLYRGGHKNYQWISDIYIYNGDFFRISNLTIGYDLSKLDFIPFRKAKVYIAANNLHVFTKYPGMDPEVGYSPEDDNNPDNDFPWGSGIDLGLYPQARTFMVGANITF